MIALFCFLCLATGLNTLAEMAEERPETTQFFLKGMSRFGIVLNAFIGASTSLGNIAGLVGVLAHMVYLSLAPSFPALDVVSAKAMGGFLLLAVHNIVAFRQFGREDYPFDQVVAYHVLCIWMIPFIIFITCSAGTHSDTRLSITPPANTGTIYSSIILVGI